jgi:hypothetical protein
MTHQGEKVSKWMPTGETEMKKKRKEKNQNEKHAYQVPAHSLPMTINKLIVAHPSLP